MTKKLISFLELFLFVLATFALLLLQLLALPLFREAHGLVVTNDLSEFSRGFLVKVLLFSSAGLCVLLGSLVNRWVPVLTPGMMANLWGTLFLFTWMDAVFALSVEVQSLLFVAALGIGVIFIYLFFFIIHYLVPPSPAAAEPWKTMFLTLWIWGWMGFYLGLSGLMAFGSLVPCFLFYALGQFMKNTKKESVLSKPAGWAFALWTAGLTGLWILERWFI